MITLGPRPVEIGDGREEAVDPIAAVVAPVGRPSAGRDVPGRGQRLAGRAFEDGEELRPIEDEAGRVAVIGVASPIVVPWPSMVPSAVLQTISALPSPSRS